MIKENIKKVLTLIILASYVTWGHADAQGFMNNNDGQDVNYETQKTSFEIDRENQIKYLKKVIKDLKKKIFIILSEKPENLTGKEEQVVKILENELAKDQPEFLNSYYKPIENLKQYSDFRKNLLEKKVSFLDLDLKKMEITFFKNGKNIAVEKIAGKGRPGSWWETPPGLYYAQDKRERVRLSLSDEENPIFMPNAIRFSGLFFIHRIPEYENGKRLPGYFTEGCVRLNLKVSQKVYDYVEAGMPILIYDEKNSNHEYNDIENFVHNDSAVSSKKYFIADLNNNKILLSKNTKKKMYLGDITKLAFMTTATEWIEVKEKKEAVWLNTSVDLFPETRLIEGEKYSLLDLGSLMLSEKSEAANEEIADRLWGIETDFMKRKSKSIGMKNFKYTNYIGDRMENTATLDDIFYLLKYLNTNREFILDMTLNKAYNKKYKKNVFSGKLNIDNFWKNSKGFKGGITGKNAYGKEYGAGVFSIKINGKVRELAFIIDNSDNLKSDTEILKGFVKFYYDR